MCGARPESGPISPGESCRVPPHESWSELERWVWQEIGSNRIVDVNTKLGTSADPKRPEGWGSERWLSPLFLETLLLHDPWRSAVPRHGIRIRVRYSKKILTLAELNCHANFGSLDLALKASFLWNACTRRERFCLMDQWLRLLSMPGVQQFAAVCTCVTMPGLQKSISEEQGSIPDWTWVDQL
jgi:hypothetical protein